MPSAKNHGMPGRQVVKHCRKYTRKRAHKALVYGRCSYRKKTSTKRKKRRRLAPVFGRRAS